jgi:hypothetical protein
VNPSGFASDVRGALNDSVDIASAIVLFLIRFVIVGIPVFLLLILPGGMATRYFVRRVKRAQLARQGQAAA